MTPGTTTASRVHVPLHVYFYMCTRSCACNGHDSEPRIAHQGSSSPGRARRLSHMGRALARSKAVRAPPSRMARVVVMMAAAAAQWVAVAVARRGTEECVVGWVGKAAGAGRAARVDMEVVAKEQAAVAAAEREAG